MGRDPTEPRNLRIWQIGLLVGLLLFWYAMTKPGLLPNFMFETIGRRRSSSASRWSWPGASGSWFITERDIYQHLWVTLVETLLAFGIGSVMGLLAGLWLALAADGQRRCSSPTSRP